jgi:Holliday junction resolvase RusA-like endonuclease
VISFSVPAVPVAQPRQRHRVVNRPGGAFVQNYTSAKHPVQAFKATTRLAFANVYQGPPLDTPIALDLLFLLPRPQRLCKKGSDPGRQPHISRPDTDNLSKAVMDALKDLAWRDDSQVYDTRAIKLYAAIGEAPGCVIKIVDLQP